MTTINKNNRMNSNSVNDLREAFGKSLRKVRKFHTVEGIELTLEDVAEIMGDESYLHVVQAQIFWKELPSGSGFNKIVLICDDNTKIEADLSKQPDINEKYEEGDELDVSSIRIYQENCFNEKHFYFEGEIL